MGVIYFNGLSSADYGIVVETFPDREWPEKVVSAYTIPGRSGDVLVDEETYSNIDRVYNVAMFVKENSTFQAAAATISKWLHSGHGYCRLEDSYEPEVYRMAYYRENASLTSLLRQGGRASITFHCKPQRYLKDGEKMMTLSASGSILNPTDYPSQPLIRIYASANGSVTIGTTIISFNEINSYVDIDCENGICYKENNLAGSKIEFSTNEFPRLEPGDNTITFGTGITSLQITPRWYII